MLIEVVPSTSYTQFEICINFKLELNPNQVLVAKESIHQLTCDHFGFATQLLEPMLWWFAKERRFLRADSRIALVARERAFCDHSASKKYDPPGIEKAHLP